MVQDRHVLATCQETVCWGAVGSVHLNVPAPHRFETTCHVELPVAHLQAAPVALPAGTQNKQGHWSGQVVGMANHTFANDTSSHINAPGNFMAPLTCYMGIMLCPQVAVEETFTCECCFVWP
jgi:hypothetical protein